MEFLMSFLHQTGIGVFLYLEAKGFKEKTFLENTNKRNQRQVQIEHLFLEITRILRRKQDFVHRKGSLNFLRLKN